MDTYGVESALANLSAAIDELDGCSVDELSDNVSNVLSEFSDLHTEVREMVDELSDVSYKLEELEEYERVLYDHSVLDPSSPDDYLDNLQDEIRDCNDRIDGLEFDLDEKQSEIDDQQSQIDELTDELAEARERNAELEGLLRVLEESA